MQIIGAYSPCGALRSHDPDCHCQEYVLNAIGHCSWNEFYDAIELIGDEVAQNHLDRLDEFRNEVNGLLGRSHLAYDLRDGKIERVGTKFEDQVIAAARGILRDPDLAGPNEQFLKAIGFFSRRPEPDVENCVKEAVGSVEGVARILLNKPSVLLSVDAKDLGARKGVHPSLQKLVENLYAYRGDAEGAAHGKTGTKPSIKLHDAELVLNASAALIVYMARLYGRSVE